MLLSPALQDFEVCSVMQTCRCQMLINQLRTMTGITGIPAQRMNMILTDWMQPPWKRQSAGLWMAWRHRNAVASTTCLLGRLPVPSAKAGQAITHKDAVEGGFIPSMTKEEQKRFTPSELVLYKHALEYRY